MEKQLISLLDFSMCGNTHLQQQALNELETFFKNEGFISFLLQFLMNEETPSLYQQITSIILKNKLANQWEEIFASDKKYIIENILDSIISSEYLIKKQLAEAFYSIICHEFPQNMNGFIEKLVEYIQSANVQEVHGSLIAIHKICFRYKFKNYQNRKPLFELIDKTFPFILNFFENILETNSEEEFKPYLILLLSKSFFSSINSAFPQYIFENDNLSRWISVFCKALEISIQLSSSENRNNIEEKILLVWWKCSKKILMIFYYLFQKLPNLSKFKNEKEKKISIEFMEKHTQSILSSILTLLSEWKKEENYPESFDPILRLCLNILNKGMLKSKTFLFLKPHIYDLLLGVILPILNFNEKDENLWENESLEFFMRELDPYGYSLILKSAAKQLFHTILTLRTGDFLQLFMEFCDKIFSDYEKDSNNPIFVIQKETVLSSLQIISKKIKNTQKYSGLIEDLIVFHVFPEFDSIHSFMRGRACSFISEFSNIKWKDINHLYQACDFVFKSLNDSCVSVQISAAIGLKQLLKTINTESIQIKEIIQDLIHKLILLANEFGIDEIISTLQIMVSRFREEIIPHAALLCQNLCDSFANMASFETENEDQKDKISLALFQTLDTISTLIDILRQNPATLQQIQNLLTTFLEQYFNSETPQFIESIIHILRKLTFHSKQIEPKMFQFFESSIMAALSYAEDIIKEIVHLLHIYISRENNLFITLENSKYPDLVFQLCKRVLSLEKLDEYNSIEICKLIESILQNSVGKIDDFIPQFIDLALSALKKEISVPALKVLLFGIVGNCLIYNPRLSLSYLHSLHYENEFFENWFLLVDQKKLKSLHSKKVAFSSLCFIMKSIENPEDWMIRLSSLVLDYCFVLFSQIQSQQDQEIFEAGEEQDFEIDSKNPNFDLGKNNLNEDPDSDVALFNVTFEGFVMNGEESDGDDDIDDNNFFGDLNQDELKDDEDYDNDKFIEVENLNVYDLNDLNQDENVFDGIDNEMENNKNNIININFDNDSDNFIDNQDEKNIEDDEDDDEDDILELFDFNTPINSISEKEVFLDSIRIFVNSNPKFSEICLNNLDQEKQDIWWKLIEN
ncbi:d-importin 7/ranbp7 [Anaeramoeba ignava]|uniref:D-importin 7/ranbp7 n=1 Tax=Anaeramoeba ignava TaxID=1746090 RepID=A0A9Q0RHQ0_ANAIG|nr:d-importin 7/ranbp7 [Anaeramoeba ignava]